MTFSPDSSDWPRSLDTAVEQLLESMSEADKEQLRNMPQGELIFFHMNWAMVIRNDFGLWEGNEELLESCGSFHPDDASMTIVRAVWERLRCDRQMPKNK